MVSLRSGEALDWRVAETLSCQLLGNTEQQMALQNCDLSYDEDDDDGNGNSKWCGQDQGVNTGKGKKPVWQDQPGEDDDIPSEHDKARALMSCSMGSGNTFVMEFVSHLSTI